MRLTDTGEKRIQGYLYMLSRALRTPGAGAFADEALKEVESHIRERLGQEADGDERAVVERVLRELGTPQRVAEAYSSEMTLDEAVTTGRFLAVTRAVWHMATTSVYGFAWAMAAFTGWTLGVSVALVAPLKVLMPNNVGVFYLNGQVHSVGAVIVAQPGVEAQPFGYWVVPVALALGAGIMVGTHRASRRVLGWIRARKAPAHIRVRVEVSQD
jgi:uncharacterized membrane protein